MKNKTYSDAKIAFVHGRPGPHPTHTELAESVNSDFYFVDKILRYHDLQDTGKVRRYVSWLLNSIFFTNRRQYDLFITEGIHLPPVIMKKLKLLNSNQKIAAMLGDEFLFFLNRKWFSPKTQKAMRYALGQFDSLLCMSKFQTELAEEIFEGQIDKPRIITAHEIISSKRSMPDNNKLKLDKHRLLFVAHGPSGWRAYYKGIETLLETFNLVLQKYDDAQLTVVGDWDEKFIDELLVKTKNTRDKIHFIGRQNDILSIFADSDLCVHITNGDAFPIATLEAIRAGLPTMVSDLTGTKEVVSLIDERLVVEMNPAEASRRIDWYFNLSTENRNEIAEKGREVIKHFSLEKGIAEFRDAVNQTLQMNG